MGLVWQMVAVFLGTSFFLLFNTAQAQFDAENSTY